MKMVQDTTRVKTRQEAIDSRRRGEVGLRCWTNGVRISRYIREERDSERHLVHESTSRGVYPLLMKSAVEIQFRLWLEVSCLVHTRKGVSNRRVRAISVSPSALLLLNDLA